MFTIDLLKGKGRPKTTDWRQMAPHAAGFGLLLVLFAGLAAAWQYDHVRLNRQKIAIADNEKMAAANSQQVKAYREASAHIGQLRKQLGQVAIALCTRIQVSDLLLELTENLPAEIILSEITLDRSAAKEKVRNDKAKNSKQMMVIRRNMTLVLCDFNSAKGAQCVEEYVAALKKAKMSSSIFKDIKPAARQQGTVDERNATYYYIECVLQEQVQNG